MRKTRIRIAVKAVIILAAAVYFHLNLGRIEAIGGETVNITDNGSLTVDDSILYETIFYRTASDPDSSVTYPLTLGRDEYFVLNDYRPQFGDSRTFGPMKKEEIRGSVILVLRHRGF